MSKISRRKLITTGLWTVAGAFGLGVAAKLVERYGLLPPDTGTLFGPGRSLTYAAQRLLTRHTMAREFDRSEISKRPFADPVRPLGEEFQRLQQRGFTGWRLAVDGMVARPTTFSLAELRSLPSRSQITFIACEEGWSYIAEWSGVPLAHVLDLVGTLPQARYVVYRSFERDWRGSIDMADALHPQTLITLGMNGGELPVPFGGPIRMRVPRQLGYKNVKYVNRLTLTDNIKQFESNFEYSWYAGI